MWIEGLNVLPKVYARQFQSCKTNFYPILNGKSLDQIKSHQEVTLIKWHRNHLPGNAFYFAVSPTLHDFKISLSRRLTWGHTPSYESRVQTWNLTTLSSANPGYHSGKIYSIYHRTSPVSLAHQLKRGLKVKEQLTIYLLWWNILFISPFYWLLLPHSIPNLCVELGASPFSQPVRLKSFACLDGWFSVDLPSFYFVDFRPSALLCMKIYKLGES